MISKYSLKYKIANYWAKKLLNFQTTGYFFSVKERVSCLVKIIFVNDGKVLLGKKIQSDSLSKVCLPYSYVDLENYEENIAACVRTAFDKLNLTLDEIDFDKNSLIDVKLDYEDNLAQITYVYKYDITDKEMSQISETYSLYDCFLLDLSNLNEYNKKSRFVTNLDYVILKKLSKNKERL